MTFAPSTKKTYQTHYRAYITFCEHIGVSPVPASPATLCRYVVFLARSLKYTSVRQYLNIVRLLHLEWGLDNPLENNFSLDCVLKGIRRGLGDCPARKLPITPELLQTIRSQLDLSSPFDCSVWAACLVMFFGMLRRSNVLAPSASKFDKTKHLRRQDCVFYPDAVRITISWSKVIQFKNRTLTLTFRRMPSALLCPVAAIFQAFRLTPHAPPDGPAFVASSGNPPFSPLTPSSFVSKVKQCLQQAGVDPKQYAGHSFRRGGASWAYQVGLPIETIRQIGDWRSYACLAYIAIPGDQIASAIAQMQCAVKT